MTLIRCTKENCNNDLFEVEQSDLDYAEGVLECEFCGEDCITVTLPGITTDGEILTIELRLIANLEGELELLRDWFNVSLVEAQCAYYMYGCEVDYRVNGKIVKYWSEEGRFLRYP